MKRPLLPLFLLLIAPTLAWGELRYEPRLDEASWESAEQSRLHCRLSQTIPFYGSASFEQKAGEELRFTMRVHRDAPREDVARLTSVPPKWMHASFIRDLGQVRVSKGDTPFTFDGPLAARLLVELEKGMFPTLSYRDWADARDDVSVAISAVNLRAALGEFHQCLDQILPYNFSHVRESTLLFDFASNKISSVAEKRLNQLAEYLLADPDVKQVIVEGYSDNIGFRTYNRRLSQERARAVQAYLTEKGVPESKFLLNYHGERKATASNRTEEGRALNRRVDVSLLK